MTRSNKKTTLAICMMFILLFTGCSNSSNTSQEQGTTENNVNSDNGTTNSESTTEDSTTDTATTESSTDILATDIKSFTGDYSDTAINAEWSKTDSTQIIMNGEQIQTSGDGVEVDGSNITISKGGTYVLSGTLNDGTVLVDVSKEDNVQLVLNGASITSSEYAPIVIKTAKNVFLTIAEGTSNTITDGAEYIYDTLDEVSPNAAIYSKTDLIINGSGTLTVNANYNDGITSKDDLEIISGTLMITAADDGIVGKDSISVRDGKITIATEGDGMKASNEEDAAKGYIVIDGGSFDITAGNDGIQAVTQLIINDGDFNIVTDGGSANASTDSSGNVNEEWGNRGGGRDQMPTEPGSQETTTATDSSSQEIVAETESSSAKALKADNGIGIFGGTFNIDSSDDSIHSNGAVRIDAGDFQIASGDDGIHSDIDMLIAGGTITITKSYEGIESQNITINDGVIDLVASDDGINIAGGNDSSSISGRPGQNTFASSSSSGVLTINGGDLTVNASGDGLDSNGSIVMNGGNVVVYGPTDSGNGALDYDQTFDITGGNLYVAGSTGMAQTTSSSSSQSSVSVGFTSTISGGTKVSVSDSSGNVVYSFTPVKDFSMVCISGADISTSETYTITAGTESVSVQGGSSSNLSSMGGGMGGGRR
mgnify:CR=1 FL=1